MTFEEMERTMQFILEQQAQFTVNQAKADERASKAEERMAESDERIARIEGIQENTARQIEHLGSALVELTEAHTRTQETLNGLAESHMRTQGALRELAEAQKHGERRLDALIDIVRGGKDAGQ
jgi:chromosome segregation ATPase